MSYSHLLAVRGIEFDLSPPNLQNSENRPSSDELNSGLNSNVESCDSEFSVMGSRAHGGARIANLMIP